MCFAPQVKEIFFKKIRKPFFIFTGLLCSRVFSGLHIFSTFYENKKKILTYREKMLLCLP